MWHSEDEEPDETVDGSGSSSGVDPKIGRDGKWQVNLYDPDGIRAEPMEFQPSAKSCCSPFLAPSPTK
jgi:hypothetical protein